MKKSRFTLLRFGVAAALGVAACVPTAVTATAASKVGRAGLSCTDTKNFSVQALHQSTFFVDAASGQDSQWVGYMVTFKTGSPAGASLTTPAGTRLVQAVGSGTVALTLTPDDSGRYFKTYALLKDSGKGTGLSHTLYIKDTAGHQNLCTYTFSKVQATAADPSNTINSIETANQTVGVNVGVTYINTNSAMTMTVRGSTGILEKNNVISFSPTPSVTWPSTIGMTLTGVRWRVGGNQFYKDRLWVSGKANQDLPYVVEYTFATEATGGANWVLKPSINVSDAYSNVHSAAGLTGAFASIAAPSTTFDAVKGKAFTMTSKLLGGQAPFTWSLTGGSLPSGLGLDSGNGNVSGTPTALGRSNFSLRVVDQVGHSGSFQYVINVFDRAIVTNEPPMAQIDADYNYGPFQASGFSGGLTWKFAGALPKGLRWDDKSQTIVGRLKSGESDTDFTLTVTDSKGESLSRSYKMTVGKTKSLPTPLNAEISDLHLGQYAIGADFDYDAGNRTEHGRNYGYVKIVPTKTLEPVVQTETGYRCADPGIYGNPALTTAVGSNDIPLRQADLGLTPLNVALDLNQNENYFCLEAEVWLTNVANSGVATAKDVRLEIDLPTGARIDNDKLTINGDLKKSDLYWDVSKWQDSNPAGATNSAPVCKVVSGFSKVDCRFSDLTYDAMAAATTSADAPSGTYATVAIPITIKKSVKFIRMRVETTTPSQEYDEMPPFEPSDLRHPNNVAQFMLYNTSLKIGSTLDLTIDSPAENQPYPTPSDPTIGENFRKSFVIPWNAGPVHVQATSSAAAVDFGLLTPTDGSICRLINENQSAKTVDVIFDDGLSVNESMKDKAIQFPHAGLCTVSATPIVPESDKPFATTTSVDLTVLRIPQRIRLVSSDSIVKNQTNVLRFASIRERHAGANDIQYAFNPVHAEPTAGSDCLVTNESMSVVDGITSVSVAAGSTLCTLNLSVAPDVSWHLEAYGQRGFNLIDGTPPPSCLTNCDVGGPLPTDPQQADPTVLPQTLAPIVLNPNAAKPIITADTKKFNSNVGITVASQPMILIIPGVPPGARLYPTNATADIIKAKVLLAQDPDTGGLIVQSDNGWTGKVKVPLIYFLNNGTAGYVRGSSAPAFVRGTGGTSEADITGAAEAMPTGTPMQVTADITIYPDPSPKGTYAPVKVAKTTINWDKSPTRMVYGYQVLSNGKPVCTVMVNAAQKALILDGKFATVVPTTCTTTGLIGPKGKLRVVALGGDETRSVEMTPKYTPKEPALTLTINFDESKSLLTKKSVALLDGLVKTIRLQGFTDVYVKGFTDVQGGKAGALPLSKARVSSTVAYLKARLPGVKFSGTGFGIGKVVAKGNNAKANAANRRAEISVR